MNGIPVIPDAAPFTPEQRAWLNGFFAGVFSRAPAGASPAPSRDAAAPSLVPLTILFGSQTGTAESLAKRAARRAGKEGFAATVLDMAQTDLTKLGAERNLLVIASTYGDGEPPDNARTLHSALAHATAATSPQRPLSSVRFSVCALGDTNYTQFCRCGADFDSYLEKLGATRVTPRADCDLDYEEKFTGWLEMSLASLATKTSVAEKRPVAAAAVTDPAAAELAPVHSRSKPWFSRLLTSRTLSGAGSRKQVRHVELDLAESGLSYEAGDLLGVFPQNCPSLVSQLLAALGHDGEEAVPAPDGSTTSLRHALIQLHDLGRPTPALLTHYAPAGDNRTTIALPQVIDAVLSRPDVRLSPVEFVSALRKLQPRLYSISSSPRAHPGQVHLTVGVVRYELNDRLRHGVCSTFLAERTTPGESRIGVFIHPNRSFRLPTNGDAPMIMIGPGTGIAPFRGFLHERRAAGARGRNWLFFGDQHEASDFLYRGELEAFAREGVLTRLDTAFSRDQSEKIYVQHRMLDHANEFFAWLEQGAHVYVCGDASRMARDVDAALHMIIERAGGKTADGAASYVQALKAAKRYSKDVY